MIRLAIGVLSGVIFGSLITQYYLDWANISDRPSVVQIDAAPLSVKSGPWHVSANLPSIVTIDNTIIMMTAHDPDGKARGLLVDAKGRIYCSPETIP